MVPLAVVGNTVSRPDVVSPAESPAYTNSAVRATESPIFPAKGSDSLKEEAGRKDGFHAPGSGTSTAEL